MLHFRRFRLVLLAAPALVLGGCITDDFGNGYVAGAAPADYGDKKPSNDAYGDAYMVGATGDYDWIDRADNLARAIGRAAPDFTFRIANSPVWAWEASNGELLLIEPKGDGVLQYYFAPGGLLYLTRSVDHSFGYDRGTLTISYDRDGRLDRGRGWDGDEATDLFVRGQQLLDAYRAYRRYGRGSYAATRPYGYDGGDRAWDNYVLVAPYAPSFDSGWSRGWQPRWRNRPDWGDWRRTHPSRDHDRWQDHREDHRPDAGGLVNRDGARPGGNAGPAGGWTGRGQGAGGHDPGNAGNRAGNSGDAAMNGRVPPPGAPAYRRDRGQADDGARDMRGGDSWSGPVTAGDRNSPARPAPRSMPAPIATMPSPPDIAVGGSPDSGPPARARRDREGFDSPPMDRPVARVPLPASDVPSPRYESPQNYEPVPPPTDAPPPRRQAAPPAYAPPQPQQEDQPSRSAPVASASATRGSDDTTGLRPD